MLLYCMIRPNIWTEKMFSGCEGIFTNFRVVAADHTRETSKSMHFIHRQTLPQSPINWRSLTYISKSEGRRLSPWNASIAHKPSSTSRSSLVHVMDSVPTSQRKIIYQFSCSVCNITYLRQASRFLGTRIKEHSRFDPNLCLALRSMDTGHILNWQDTPILESAY